MYEVVNVVVLWLFIIVIILIVVVVNVVVCGDGVSLGCCIIVNEVICEECIVNVYYVYISCLVKFV